MRHDALSSVTVVIASWGTPEHTLRSAGAVMADGVPAERVVVVDDGSGDDSADRLARELPDCRVVRLEQSVGYANAGAAALAGTSYLILNNDAFVHTPGSVGRMLEALSCERVAIVVPRLVNPDLTLQPSVRPIDTPSVALVRASGLSRFVPNRHQPNWSTHWDHAESREIHAADGAVLPVRGEARKEPCEREATSAPYPRPRGLSAPKRRQPHREQSRLRGSCALRYVRLPPRSSWRTDCARLLLLRVLRPPAVDRNAGRVGARRRRRADRRAGASELRIGPGGAPRAGAPLCWMAISYQWAPLGERVQADVERLLLYVAYFLAAIALVREHWLRPRWTRWWRSARSSRSRTGCRSGFCPG